MRGGTGGAVRRRHLTVQWVRLPSRFCGPPGSANGGYACGVVASDLSHPVEVTLHAPPPLEVDLSLEVTGGTAQLLAEGVLVATAREADVAVPAPTPPAYERVLEASAQFDHNAYSRSHAYPGCFTCGPEREEGDGLRIFPGAAERPDLRMWPWTPRAFATDPAVPEPVVWAALDCQSGFAALAAAPSPAPIVLGRMTAVLHAAVPAHEPVIVAGWPGSVEGRKRHAGSAVWSRDGRLLAASRTTWLVLT